MRRKLTALGGTALAVAAIGGYLLMGHASAAGQYGSTFSIVESGVGTYVDEATHTTPDFSTPTPPGDSIVFSADLLQDGARVGVAHGDCTAVIGTQYICDLFFVVTHHGSLALQVPFDLAHPSGDYVVTGGTGEFAGRDGWAHFTTLSNGDEVHTFHLDG